MQRGDRPHRVPGQPAARLGGPGLQGDPGNAGERGPQFLVEPGAVSAVQDVQQPALRALGADDDVPVGVGVESVGEPDHQVGAVLGEQVAGLNHDSGPQAGELLPVRPFPLGRANLPAQRFHLCRNAGVARKAGDESFGRIQCVVRPADQPVSVRQLVQRRPAQAVKLPDQVRRPRLVGDVEQRRPVPEPGGTFKQPDRGLRACPARLRDKVDELEHVDRLAADGQPVDGNPSGSRADQ